jgi:hypothetical protein
MLVSDTDTDTDTDSNSASPFGNSPSLCHPASGKGDSDKGIYSFKNCKIPKITIRITYHQIKVD